MAVVVSYNGRVRINGTDLSDHCKMFKLNDGQDTREVTAHGDTLRKFRAGLANLSAEAEFFLDHAASSVEATLRPLVTIASTGFLVELQKVAGSTTTPTSATNPLYSFTGILDGDITLLNESIGEVATLTAKFLPYSGSLTLTTTSS